MRLLHSTITALLTVCAAPPAWAEPPSVQRAKLTPSDAAARQSFGSAVSMSGDTAVVGAEGDDHAGESSGAAYVYLRVGTAWAEQAKLTANNPKPEHRFGAAVAISGDTIVIGSTDSTYVFVRDGDSWVEQAELQTTGVTWLSGGPSVAIHEDTIVVGAPQQTAAYVFQREHESWNEATMLTPEDVEHPFRFGAPVAVWGHTVLVADPHDSGGSSLFYQGAVHVYEHDGDGWEHKRKLVGSDSMAYDKFGSSISLTEDTMMIGARFVRTPDQTTYFSRGAAYVFEHGGEGWLEAAKLTPSDDLAIHFGSSVSLSGDLALVGIGTEDEEGFGAASLSARNEGAWVEQAQLIGDDAHPDDYISDVALSGETALVGLGVAADYAGVTYVFDDGALPPNLPEDADPDDADPGGADGGDEASHDEEVGDDPWDNDAEATTVTQGFCGCHVVGAPDTPGNERWLLLSLIGAAALRTRRRSYGSSRG